MHQGKFSVLSSCEICLGGVGGGGGMGEGGIAGGRRGFRCECVKLKNKICTLCSL